MGRYSVLFQEQNREVAKKLGTATLCMFTLPIFVFYMTLPLFENYFVKEERMAWSGGLAVMTVNLIIAGYVISAFQEEEDFDNKDNDRYLKDKNTEAVLVAGKYKEKVD